MTLTGPPCGKEIAVVGYSSRQCADYPAEREYADRSAYSVVKSHWVSALLYGASAAASRKSRCCTPRDQQTCGARTDLADHFITVLVKHGPHVSGLRARERAKPHWKSWLSTTFLELPSLFFSRAKGSCLTRTVIPCHAACSSTRAPTCGCSRMRTASVEPPGACTAAPAGRVPATWGWTTVVFRAAPSSVHVCSLSTFRSAGLLRRVVGSWYMEESRLWEVRRA